LINLLSGFFQPSPIYNEENFNLQRIKKGESEENMAFQAQERLTRSSNQGQREKML